MQGTEPQHLKKIISGRYETNILYLLVVFNILDILNHFVLYKKSSTERKFIYNFFIYLNFHYIF